MVQGASATVLLEDEDCAFDKRDLRTAGLPPQIPPKPPSPLTPPNDAQLLLEMVRSHRQSPLWAPLETAPQPRLPFGLVDSPQPSTDPSLAATFPPPLLNLPHCFSINDPVNSSPNISAILSPVTSPTRGNSRKNEVALETPNTPPRAGSLLP